MCCWGGKKDLGLSVAASATKVFGEEEGGFFPETSKSIQIKSAC